MSKKRMYILYDGRACGAAGTEDASVLVACGSNKEAHYHRGEYGEMACYSFAVAGDKLVDERWEWDYRD